MAARDCQGAPEKYLRDRRRLLAQLGLGVGDTSREGHTHSSKRRGPRAGRENAESWQRWWRGGARPSNASGSPSRSRWGWTAAACGWQGGSTGPATAERTASHYGRPPHLPPGRTEVAAAAVYAKEFQQGTAASQNGASADGRLLPTVPRAYPLSPPHVSWGGGQSTKVSGCARAAGNCGR